MLASAGLIRGASDDYAFAPKLDGWRALISVASGKLAVRTRNGNDVTAAVPELPALGPALFGRSLVLDGELVAHDGAPSSFYRLSGRMGTRRPQLVAAASARTPATFVAFDVLWSDEDLTALPYRARRMILEDLDLQGPAWCTVSSFPGAGPELFAACHALGLEGLVAKRVESPYEQGKRSRHWIKAKCADWLERHGPLRHGH
jgi:bifunctional non-homologous end joining protein LigD